MNFKPIPEQFKLDQPLEESRYLINGELIHWAGDKAVINSSISSTMEYKPTYLGSVPNLEEKQGLEALRRPCKLMTEEKANGPPRR